MLHMGHVRNYTMGDVVARYKRARGFAVMHPMGWDAFGLPAENAARERGIHPAQWTSQNIACMRAGLQRMGLSLDWDREFATCDPAYYGHQQKLFLDFWRAGLAERKESWVNWDPVDGTVLANEQVIDGRGWRSGALVEKKQLNQWFLKITDYAQELLDALDSLDRWPERVRLMQARWIGRSEGARLRFEICHAPLPNPPPLRGRGSRTRSRSTPRGRTRCSACRSWRWRRSILLSAGGGGARSAGGGVRRRMPPDGYLGSGHRDGGKAGLRHRAAGAAPVPEGCNLPGVDRQLRAHGIRHRRDLRLPGA